MDTRLKKIITAAVFAALTCAATMLIQIPTLTKGYVNLGDGIVILAGWICGAPWGFAAAGLGSALADILSGYALYAPATFIIKGLIALIAAAIMYAFKERLFIGRVVSAVTAELFMAMGYFLYEWIFITGSFEASVIGIPENLIQGTVGVLASVTVMTALERTKALKMLKFK